MCNQTCLTFTWYCDGQTIWLHQIDETYSEVTTFDYDYNLYTKMSDEKNAKQLRSQRLHTKIAELQKELATLKKEKHCPNG